MHRARRRQEIVGAIQHHNWFGAARATVFAREAKQFHSAGAALAACEAKLAAVIQGARD